MHSCKMGLAALGVAACCGITTLAQIPTPSADRPATQGRALGETPGTVGVLLPPRSSESRTAKFAGKKMGEVLLHAMQTIRTVNDLPGAEQGAAMAEAADAYAWVAEQAAKQSGDAAREARELRDATAQLRKDHAPVMKAQEQLTNAGVQFEEQLGATRRRAEAARARAAHNPDDPSLQAIARFEFSAWKNAEQAANQARQIIATNLAANDFVTAKLQLLDLRIRCRESDAALLNMASNGWAANAKALRTLGDLTTRLGDFSREPAVNVDWMQDVLGQGTQLSPNDEREFQAWVSGSQNDQNN